MSLADAWMLKGWLMRDERATPEIMAAVEAVISALANPRIETPIPLIQLPAQTDAEVDPPDTSAPKRRGGSDEAKAAAAERMRVRLASRREAKASSSLSAIFHGSEGLRKLETGCASITSGMSNHAGTEIDNPPFGVKVDGCGLDAVSRMKFRMTSPLPSSSPRIGMAGNRPSCRSMTGHSSRRCSPLETPARRLRATMTFPC